MDSRCVQICKISFLSSFPVYTTFVIYIILLYIYKKLRNYIFGHFASWFDLNVRCAIFGLFITFIYQLYKLKFPESHNSKVCEMT